VGSVPSGAEAWLVIAADGTVALSTQCKRWDSHATTGDGTLTFGPLKITSRACIDNSRQEEDAERLVREVLDGETTYQIEEHSLSITKGQKGLTFRAE
jgi:heat shock protein HslJ